MNWKSLLASALRSIAPKALGWLIAKLEPKP